VPSQKTGHYQFQKRPLHSKGASAGGVGRWPLVAARFDLWSMAQFGLFHLCTADVFKIEHLIWINADPVNSLSCRFCGENKRLPAPCLMTSPSNLVRSVVAQ
jgi:hypothetical protein